MPTEILTANIVKEAACPEGKPRLDLFDAQCKGLNLEIEQRVAKPIISDIDQIVASHCSSSWQTPRTSPWPKPGSWQTRPVRTSPWEIYQRPKELN